MFRFLYRPLVPILPYEASHRLAVSLIRNTRTLSWRNALRKLTHKPSHDLSREAFGIMFPNPLGVAAGFDRDAEMYNGLQQLGFGFVEIGSLSPEAQFSKESPDIHRNTHNKSISWRTYSNNKGVRNAIANLQKDKPKVVVAANITPMLSSTRVEQMVEDYRNAFTLMYDFADMFVINTACQNANGILPIQEIEDFKEVLDPILDERVCCEKYKPVLVKISPDLQTAQLDPILEYCMLAGVDGIVAGSGSRDFSDKHTRLSGAPLFDKALGLVKYITFKTNGRMPVIGCGGISTPEQAAEMLDAGATLIEINSALHFEGLRFPRKVIRFLEERKDPKKK